MSQPVLDGDDRHHLERVLRVRVGDLVTVADGAGAWRCCMLAAAGRLEPGGEVCHVPPPAPTLAVAFAVTKGDRPELAVQKLTELGIDRMTPFHAQRSVARWEGDRAARHVARLRRVAREASMQCRRTWLPVVDELADLRVLLGAPGVALADPAGAPPTLAHPTVVIGPEGGFTDDERALASANVRLGPLVLRAETAAIAAGALLAGLRDDLVQPR